MVGSVFDSVNNSVLMELRVMLSVDVTFVFIFF